MATDDTSRRGWAFRLTVLALVVSPLVAQWASAGADLLPAIGVLGIDALPTDAAAVDVLAVGAPALLRVVGVGVAVLVVLLLVRQKRRTRGQRPSEGAAERESDRDVEGSGEVYAPYAYNNQQRARRESERIRDRAEEIAEADRSARNRQ